MIYPRQCPGCREAIPPDVLICEHCWSKFVRIGQPACMRCGRRLNDDEAELCGACEKSNHHYRQGMAVFTYDGPVRKAMSDLKFNGFGENADFFASEAIEQYGSRISNLAPDAIVPVPIHRSKRAYRGYNQAELIAGYIAEALEIPMVTDLLTRKRRTLAQKRLNPRSRADNLMSAFACDTSKYTHEEVARRYKHVLLVDDIYTTGATMENCTCALLAAGVETVDILSIAIGKNY